MDKGEGSARAWVWPQWPWEAGCAWPLTIAAGGREFLVDCCRGWIAAMTNHLTCLACGSPFHLPSEVGMVLLLSGQPRVC